jgi:hypothetical protein
MVYPVFRSCACDFGYTPYALISVDYALFRVTLNTHQQNIRLQGV